MVSPMFSCFSTLFPGECGEKKIKIAVALPLFVLDHSPQKTGQNKIQNETSNNECVKY